jgi:hypothetical protein
LEKQVEEDRRSIIGGETSKELKSQLGEITDVKERKKLEERIQKVEKREQELGKAERGVIDGIRKEQDKFLEEHKQNGKRFDGTRERVQSMHYDPVTGEFITGVGAAMELRDGDVVVENQSFNDYMNRQGQPAKKQWRGIQSKKAGEQADELSSEDIWDDGEEEEGHDGSGEGGDDGKGEGGEGGEGEGGKGGTE